MFELVPLFAHAPILSDATSAFVDWMEHAYYPSLLLVFIIASLGVPIPEDIPLIAAGVLIRTHPEIATWIPTFIVAGIGIMSGDVVLYSLGRRWGRGVFGHRSVSWLITPARLEKISESFHRHGTWMVFFGRLFVGIRAAMCLTAGITRFPFWRFLLADAAGAALSIPVFVGLGYAFAGMLPLLRAYLLPTQSAAGIALGLLLVGFVLYEVRKHRRRAAARAAETTSSAVVASAEAPLIAPEPPPPSRTVESREPRDRKACPTTV